MSNITESMRRVKRRDSGLDLCCTHPEAPAVGGLSSVLSVELDGIKRTSPAPPFISKGGETAVSDPAVSDPAVSDPAVEGVEVGSSA